MAEIINTTVLDFYGLPGGGKTTISHEIAMKLAYSSKTVVEPSFDYDHRLKPEHRKLKKLFDTICFGITHVKRFCVIVTIVKNNATSWNDGLSDVINITTKIAMINKYKAKRDYIIFDEGIAQAAISLMTDSPENAGSIFQKICRLLDEPYCIKLIRVDCKKDVALDRVLKRKSKDTRVEKMSSELEMNNFMEQFEKAIKSVDEIPPSSMIDHCKIEFLEEL